MKEVKVPFKGWDLIAWANEQGADARVAIRPICEAMGIAWQRQHSKITNDPRFSCNHMVTTGADGKQYQMVTLPVKELNGWLFGINSRKVKPEVAPLLLDFQRYCCNHMVTTGRSYGAYQTTLPRSG